MKITFEQIVNDFEKIISDKKENYPKYLVKNNISKLDVYEIVESLKTKIVTNKLIPKVSNN